MIRRRGTLFVVSAPSGAGKTTLCREARLGVPGLAYSVSVTTRAPRPGEIDGVDFRFVDEASFRAMLGRGEFAEWATVHGHLYGTPARALEEALAGGGDVLLDIDTQGAAQVRARYPEAVLIFLVAPSLRDLEQRLRERRARGDRGGQGRVPREGRERNAEGMSLAGRELILGVTGSIAAYKAVYLLRELTRLGACVTVCLSEHAREFVGALTFRTLSGRPVLTNLFDPQSEDAVEHVALAERAAAIVVAPATANLIAKAAHAVADDFLTTLLLAARCPVLMAPAMDGGMWEHPAVTANVATLRARGVTVMEPDSGALASGLTGRGRLPEPESIVAALASVLAPAQDLTGDTIVLPAGPTREPLD